MVKKMHGKLALTALASLLAAGCGSPDDTQAPADPAESAETTASGQPIEALDRAASVQQTLDETEKKRREAIEEQGD
jgi:ABC-type glycerol-3-phosphate transport system substrate-binding protein